MFSMAMWMAALVGPVQLVLGDLHGLNTLRHQPTKIDAMEGLFDTAHGASMVVIGWPDAAAQKTLGAIEIPHLASLYLTHSWDGEVKGLKDFPKDWWPTNLPLVFWAFRVMVGMGLLIIALGLTSLWLRRRGTLFETRWFQRCAVAAGPAGLIAVSAGWIVTEAGRQPFTVYGHLRTAESLGPVAAPAIAASLAVYAIVYFIVFGATIAFLFHLFNQTPQEHDPGPPPHEPVRTAGIVPGIAAGPPGQATTGAVPLRGAGR
jgi:cytochrome d ubiquinol oxidase subunit I